MNERRFILVIALGIIIMFSSFYITVATAFPDNPGTYTYFEKVCNQPYIYTEGSSTETHFWQYGGDCDDRAMVFKNYLQSRGVKDVQICKIFCWKDGTQVQIANGAWGHAFVVWNNKVYDPQPKQGHAIYGMSVPEYKTHIKRTFGFNMWFNENDTVGTPF